MVLFLTYVLILCRHAHPGSPYVFGLVGVDHDLDFPEPMPVVGMAQKLALVDIISYPCHLIFLFFFFGCS